MVLASQEVLATHAKSFRLASVFLPDDARDDAAVLYAVCRLVDDLADEADDEAQARRHLLHLRWELDGERTLRPLIGAFLLMAQRRELELDSMRELVTGVESDLEEVIFQTDEELMRYCYRVAGTVGLMMCSILGVRDKAALAHAIDLGVAMQLTNICRDVKEDAERGRVYIPASRLRAEGLSSGAVLDQTADREALGRAVEGLLDLSEAYYASGDRGMKFIPTRARLAIVVASRVYRAIGLRLRRRGTDVLAGRTVVPSYAKFFWVLRSLLLWIALSPIFAGRTTEHDASLHSHLKGLPGVSE